MLPGDRRIAFTDKQTESNTATHHCGMCAKFCSFVVCSPIIVCINHYRKQHCVATVNAAKLLMKSLFFELNIQEYQLNVLKLVITVLLYSLCKMDILVELDEKGLTETLGVCELALQEWLKREDVVGGIYFGKSVQKATKLLYESTELKVRESAIHFKVVIIFLTAMVEHIIP